MLLQHDPTTAEVLFSQLLLISYERDKNISNFVVNTTLKSDNQPGIFKCTYTRVRCRTCPFISYANKIPDLRELLPSPIISRAFLPISSAILPVPYAKKYTLAKQAEDWVTVSANTLELLRPTIKTLPNQSRDISTSPTILKNTLRFVAFLSL